MRRIFIERLLNVLLRGFSMGCRFILMVAIAKLLTPAEVGLFGLMMATVSISVLIIGADFYTYAQRELLARPPEQWSFVLQHQIKAQIFLYGLLVPAQLIIFFTGMMSWKYAAWFFVLLLLEHLAQEINRVLVAMHKQLLASCILFIRMSSWVLAVIPVMIFFEQYRNIETLYVAWLTGCALAVAVGLIAIRKIVIHWTWYKTDTAWLIKGFKVGVGFLISTFCFKGLLTFDRYAIEALSNLEVLGVYVFFIGIVMGLYSFLDPAVFSFLYPKMLQSYQAHQKEQYQKIFKELMISTTLISLALAAFIWVSTPQIINWIDKPIYAQHLESLGMLIIAGFIYSIGHIPHYALYAMKGDKWIVAAHISAMLLFLLLVKVLNLENGIQTVTTALIMAFSWVMIIKTIGCFYTRQNSPLLRCK